MAVADSYDAMTTDRPYQKGMTSDDRQPSAAGNSLILPASLEHLAEFIDFVRGQAQSYEFTPQRIQEIQLALEEVLVNIINYAYPTENHEAHREVTADENPETIELLVKAAAGPNLVLEIRDRGIKFNPLDRVDPDIDTSLEERAIGGLGIFFLKQFSDRLFWHHQDNYNCLEITFEPRHAP